MNIKKFLIAGGNPTALVYNCRVVKRNTITKKLLKEVEQVGFISTKQKLPKLTMMGGELCINATLAFASTLSKNGKLFIDSLNKPIAYANKKGITTIKVPFKIKKNNNIILLNGIGFVLYDKKEKNKAKKTDVLSLCKKYELPAFGEILYSKNKIEPYVHVAGINSFVKETACGSGSVAFSIYSGIKDVIQPTGKTISVNKTNIYNISAEVTKFNI